MSNHSFENEKDDQLMGLMTSYRWRHQPLGVLFMLARYKFVAKMLEGYRRVAEIGCGDGFGTRIVQTSVKSLMGIDIDEAMIRSAIDNQSKFGSLFLLGEEIKGFWDAIYALDVIEHMPYQEGRKWLIELSLHAPVVIIGSPSKELQPYASPLSAVNHINCMTGPQLKELMQNCFKHVFMFSMNDEIVHTGFSPMSCYNFALGVN